MRAGPLGPSTDNMEIASGDGVEARREMVRGYVCESSCYERLGEIFNRGDNIVTN